VASRYEPAFDGLRAVAIAAVMGFHYVPWIVTGGSLGVDVFFPLSGWLITSILLRETERSGRVDYLAFLQRRVWRLVPPLAALFVAYALLAPWLIPRAASGRWVDIAVSAAFVSNLRETFWPRGNPLAHLWFLGVQVQFYLVWPAVIMALKRLDRDRAALVLVAAWAALTIAKVLWNEAVGGPGAYYFTPFHATGLILGSALAFRPINVGRAGWPALALLAVMMVFGRTSAHPLLTFAVLQPVAEWATIVLLAGPVQALRLAPLPFVGRVSYGVYLWHVPFMWILHPLPVWHLAVLVPASLAAGWLSWRLIEQPLAAVRRQPAAAATPP
jgi:peptidoglycan/LPS O-acetylase OafA/YrhL